MERYLNENPSYNSQENPGPEGIDRGNPNLSYVSTSSREAVGVYALSEHTGVPVRKIYAIRMGYYVDHRRRKDGTKREHRYENVSFNVADRLLTRMGFFLAWYQDEELRELYHQSFGLEKWEKELVERVPEAAAV